MSILSIFLSILNFLIPTQSVVFLKCWGVIAATFLIFILGAVVRKKLVYIGNIEIEADKKLYKKLDGIINVNSMRNFFEKLGAGCKIEIEKVSRIDRFKDVLIQPENEYFDKKIEKCKKLFYNKIKELCNFAGEDFYPDRGSGSFTGLQMDSCMSKANSHKDGEDMYFSLRGQLYSLLSGCEKSFEEYRKAAYRRLKV